MNKAAIILGIFSLISVGLCEESAEDKPKGPVVRARLEVRRALFVSKFENNSRIPRVYTTFGPRKMIFDK
jgi:hypothetical protein